MSAKHWSGGSCWILCNSPAADAESVVYAVSELSAGWVRAELCCVLPSSRDCTALGGDPARRLDQGKHPEEINVTATGILIFQSTLRIFTFRLRLKKSARNCSSCGFVRKKLGRFTMVHTRTETLQHCHHCRLADTPRTGPEQRSRHVNSQEYI